MNQVTDWFDVSVKPVHIGVYQTYDPILKEEFYNYFDGEDWNWGHPLVQYVSICTDVIDKGHVRRWRGLANKQG